MNVLFLDYDGVVNTPMWDESGRHCRFNFPEDNKVNNFQSVQWVSEFCEKHSYDIVVTSTWRLDKNYVDCLVNGGLREGVKVIGKTPSLPNLTRCDEITEYLNTHREVEKFIILDDDPIEMGTLEPHWIQCDANRGFGLEEYYQAEFLDNSFEMIRRL